jgi:hypothetical protein
MVSMKPIFRETAGTFFGIAFLYRQKERSARWLTQLPATSPIHDVPSAQPLRAVSSGERRLRAKVQEQLCHWPRLPLGTTPGPGRRSVLSDRSAVFVSLALGETKTPDRADEEQKKWKEERKSNTNGRRRKK